MYYNIMFAAYVDHVHVHCVGFAQFYYFYNYKETVSLLIVYYITLVTIIFNCVAFYFPEKQKYRFFSFKTPPLAHAQFQSPPRGWPSY